MSEGNDPKRQKVIADGMPSEQGSAAAAGAEAAPTVEDVIFEKAMDSETSGVYKLLTKTVVDTANTQAMDTAFKIERTKYAFFMKMEGADGIRFRHEGGVTGEDSPSVVYLAAKKEQSDGKLTYQSAPESRGHIAVYYSASGSGKTVELAVSSVTRAAHLTLLVTLGDDISEQEINDKVSEGENQYKWKRQRNSLAYSKLSEAIVNLVGSHKDSFVDIVKAALPKGGAKSAKLQLVVGIDEASNCPLIVRSLLSNQEWAARTLRTSLASELKIPDTDLSKVNFQFSIAGTGAASATIGYLDSTFEHKQTSAVKFPYLYPLMALKEEEILLSLPGNSEISAIKLDTIKENLPILYTTMENARMASIALKTLRDLAKKGRNLVEKSAVNDVCQLFIKSNGLLEISENAVKKNAVGACAFAMLLFQEDIPDFTSQADEMDKYYSEFSCGFNFDLSVVDKFHAKSQEKARFKLVSKYGLLEPSNISNDSTEHGEGTAKPFKMLASQQLIALSLLGVDLSKLVQSDPFGFEVLSTHTMKAALAASSVVAWEARKSVKETLEKVGCMIDTIATHSETVAEWEELGSYFVVRHEFKSLFNKRLEERWPGDDGLPTRLLNVELEVGRSDDDTKDVLFIERPYREVLCTAYPDATGNFHPPIAAVNHGNSVLADGYITCFVAKKEWAEVVTKGAVVKWNQDQGPVKFTAMNQAKDKLGLKGTPKGQLPATKLKTHAERCRDPVLDGLFGKKRLLFVSTPRNMNAQGRVSVQRRWLPRVMVNCKILKALMGPLAMQRTHEARMQTCADCVDGNGTLINVTYLEDGTGSL